MIARDKYFILLAFIILGTIGIYILNLIGLKQSETARAQSLAEIKIKFNTYLARFNKSYSGEEYVKRLGNFKKSLEEIANLNSENGTGADYGLTKFSDLSQAEFGKLMHNPSYATECKESENYCRHSPRLVALRKKGYIDLLHMADARLVRDAWDWRAYNIVSPVLDKKRFNGDWAFSIAGVMESMEVIQRGRTYTPYTQRSVQELIDCSTNEGHVTKVLEFLCSKNLSIIPQDKYPLQLVQGSCDFALIDKYKSDGRILNQYWTKCNLNEKIIISKIFYHGPVIAVVNSALWQHYAGGIIHRACYRNYDGTDIDHVVHIVGYNLRNVVPYYIVKTSWGEDFGENGYVKLAVGFNLCGVADEITYFNVK